MSDIFISYNNKDKDKAKLFATLLTQQGWSVFWDKNIPPGKTFDDYIGEQLDAAKCIIVLWSKNSVSSDWVKEEAQRGAARKVLVPIFVEQVAPPLGFGRIEAAELIAWDGNTDEVEFQSLLHAIALLIPEGERAQTPSHPPAKPEPTIAKKPDKESMSSSQQTLPRFTKTQIISGLAGLIFLVALAAAWQVFINSQPRFGVVFGSDSEPRKALDEVMKYTNKPDAKTGIYFAKTAIYFLENSYRSVALTNNKEQADKYIEYARTNIRIPEGPKMMDTWCVNPEWKDMPEWKDDPELKDKPELKDGYWICQKTPKKQ